LASCCFALVNVNKDFFYKELHQPAVQAILRAFATDKKYRTLVVIRAEKPSEEQKEEPAVEVRFSLKVEYLGQTAHSIAFLKRDDFQVLDLKACDAKPLSSQVQVVNLGFVGEDSSVFELAFNYVEFSFIPLFNTYKQGPAQTEKSSSLQGLDSVQKDLMQLKVHLN